MLVSIIIPTYNTATYIQSAIDSILNQTYKNFEIIVVDDGSTDNTKEILNPYITKKQIRYFYKDNGGVSSARNYGLERAKGDYITFLDADDMYIPDKLEKQIAVFQANKNVDVVYNDVILIDKDNNKVGILKSEEIIKEPINFFAQILYRQSIPAIASIMMKRECIDEGVSYPEEYKNAEDYSFLIQLAEKYTFYYLEEPLYYYRRHTENLTNNHLAQVNCEKAIVKSLGIKKIKEVITNTTYTEFEKTMLFSKILLKIDEFDNALQELNNVHAEDWEYYFLKGVLYYHLKDYLKARQNFLKSISIDNKAESYNNLGCSFYQLNDLENAIRSFNTAKKLRKLYNDPIYNLKALREKKCVKITERKLRKVLTNYNS